MNRLNMTPAPQTDPPEHARNRTRRSPLQVLFWLVAAGFVFAALFHVVALVVPGLAGDSPAWRHALFVLINAAVAVLLVRRPRWFAYVFAALCVQQLYSHGRAGYSAWTLEQRIDWASVLVLLAVPPLAALLLWDSRSSQTRDSCGG